MSQVAMSPARRSVIRLLLILIAICLALLLYLEGSRERPPAPGEPAPAFELTDYRTGKPVRLADHAGKVVLVNFWATWCPPCQREIPGFIAVRDRLAKDFEILGIATDTDGAAAVLPFAREKGITYPVLATSEATEKAYGGIRAIPTSFLLDRQGRVVQVWRGAIDDRTLTEAVTSLL